jgi:hypothetical protein
MSTTSVEITLITKADPSPELKSFEKVILSNLNSMEQGSIKLAAKCSSSLTSSTSHGKHFTIYVGYDYKILAHFFSKLDQDTFFIFLGPAGSDTKVALEDLLRNCTDYMDTDASIYKKIAHSWSYKEVISYVKQKQKALAA